MRKELEDVTQELDGFEDLDPVDQEKVMAAFALGHVREKDMTPCLRENEHEHVEERKEVIDKGDATATSHDHSKNRASKKAGKKRGPSNTTTMWKPAARKVSIQPFRTIRNCRNEPP